MPLIMNQVANVYRDGPTGSPTHPDKTAIRSLFRRIDGVLEAVIDGSASVQGAWDASAGTFPGGGTAETGDVWFTSVAGTVNGVFFGIGDRVVALVDNASTTTYAANWIRMAAALEALIPMTNVGAGTANAIVATTDRTIPPTDGSALIALPLTHTNTSEDVTVTLNGGTPLEIRMASGAKPLVGSLRVGASVHGYITGGGTVLRLIQEYSPQIVLATNASGTNDIVASTAWPVPAGTGEAFVILPITSSVTAAARLNLNGTGLLPILQANGQPAGRGVLLANNAYQLYRSGAAWKMVDNVTLSFMRATNTNDAPNQNAIRASTPHPVPQDGSVLIAVNLVSTNTGTATIVFNGLDGSKTVRDLTGETTVPGALKEGMTVLGSVIGSNFQLYHDVNTRAASQLNVTLAGVARDEAREARDAAVDAEAGALEAQNLARRWASDPEDGAPIDDGINPPGQSAYHHRKKAEAAKDIAAGHAAEAVSQGHVPIISTVAGAGSLPIPDGIIQVLVNGYYASGDWGAPMPYLLLEGGDPGHAAAFSTNDGEKWWQFAGTKMSPLHVGAQLATTKNDAAPHLGVPDSTAECVALPAAMQACGVVEMEIPHGYIRSELTIPVFSGMRVKGSGPGCELLRTTIATVDTVGALGGWQAAYPMFHGSNVGEVPFEDFDIRLDDGIGTYGYMADEGEHTWAYPSEPGYELFVYFDGSDQILQLSMDPDAGTFSLRTSLPQTVPLATVTLPTGVDTSTNVLTTDDPHGISTGAAISLSDRDYIPDAFGAYPLIAGSSSGMPPGLRPIKVYFARSLSPTTISLHYCEQDAINDVRRVSITGGGSHSIFVRAAPLRPLANDPTLVATAELPGAVDTTADSVTTSSNHNRSTGSLVVMTSTGTMPGGLTSELPVYVRAESATALTFYPTRADAIDGTNRINLSSEGTGTLSILQTVAAIANASTGVNTTNDTITTIAAHGRSTRDSVIVTSSNSMPGGLTSGAVTYVRAISTTVLAFYPTSTDAHNDTNRIDLTSTGSGTLSIRTTRVSMRATPASAVDTTNNTILFDGVTTWLTTTRVALKSTGDMPGGLTDDPMHKYHIRETPDGFAFYNDPDDARVDTNRIPITSQGTGILTIRRGSMIQVCAFTGFNSPSPTGMRRSWSSRPMMSGSRGYGPSAPGTMGSTSRRASVSPIRAMKLTARSIDLSTSTRRRLEPRTGPISTA